MGSSPTFRTRDDGILLGSPTTSLCSTADHSRPTGLPLCSKPCCTRRPLSSLARPPDDHRRGWSLGTSGGLLHHLRRDRPAGRFPPPRRHPAHHRGAPDTHQQRVRREHLGRLAPDRSLGLRRRRGRLPDRPQGRAGGVRAQGVGPVQQEERGAHERNSSSASGGLTVILARFVPIVRTFAPVAAGVGHMPWRRYSLYNFNRCHDLGLRPHDGRIPHRLHPVGARSRGRVHRCDPADRGRWHRGRHAVALPLERHKAKKAAAAGEDVVTDAEEAQSSCSTPTSSTVLPTWTATASTDRVSGADSSAPDDHPAFLARSFLRPRHARAQRFHEVDDLAALCRLLGFTESLGQRRTCRPPRSSRR